ncbi:MAG: DUF1553 domain-containing protein [Spirochaetes bacterium]|nr:DUF1553 domain-containing protein [Spirochaetota bacterium]
MRLLVSVFIFFPVVVAAAEHPLDKIYSRSVARVKRADDLQLFRRLSLQLRGNIPSPAETMAFLSEARPDKLKIYAAEFLRSPEFAEYWGNWLGSVLRERTRERDHVYGAFNAYLTDSLNHNKTYTQMVTEMLLATGNQRENPASSFYLRDMADPVEVAEYAGRVFYGQKVTCARCHNHPYDAAFTQKRYYAFAAFFAQVYAVNRVDFPPGEIGSVVPPQNTWERFSAEDRQLTQKLVQKWRKEHMQKLTPEQKKAQREKNKLEFARLAYEARFGLRMPPDAGEGDALIEPVFLDGSRPVLKPGDDRRKALVAWLTADKNPRFRRVFINRVWSRLTGQRFFSPFDDWRADTKLAREPLLAHLDQEFLRQKTDIKSLILHMVSSDAWARESAPDANADEGRYFKPVRLDADQLFNSLLTATRISSVRNISQRSLSELRADFTNLKGMKTTRAPVEKNRDYSAACEIERPAPRNSFLAVFGAGDRTDIEDDDAAPTLEQVLVLLNGQLTRNLVRETAKDGAYFEKQYDESRGHRSVAEAAFIAVLNRPLAEDEWKKISDLTEPKYLKGKRKYSRDFTADLVWSLINSQEFIHVR